jgi:photosystem II stability/assembly factor-like uncharacterized protein
MAIERRSERQGGEDSAWLIVFAVLVAGGLAAALVLSRGNDGPPLPTFSPEPTATTPPMGPTAPPTEDESDRPSPTASATADERKAVFGPVHGLARSGRGLLLAAEDGLWQLGEGGARRVDGPRHRFSTLLRRDGGELLASGLSADGEPLGVIASGDNGRSWQVVSLGGEAAFKRLAEQGGTVHGWEVSTGTLLRSTDLRSWERVAEQRGVLDFAVHPTEPSRMVRAVPEGGVGLPEVQESRDGGRSWKRIAAPSLNIFGWAEPDALWALTEDGTVFLSTDQGYSWTPRGVLPAPPTAFLTVGEVQYAALRDVGVYRSADRGRTWVRIDL